MAAKPIARHTNVGIFFLLFTFLLFSCQKLISVSFALAPAHQRTRPTCLLLRSFYTYLLCNRNKVT